MVYQAGPPPEKVERLGAYLEEQLAEVSGNLDTINNLALVELNVEPIRPRDGMVALADGTNWDPGSGAGFYGYIGASWVSLGGGSTINSTRNGLSSVRIPTSVTFIETTGYDVAGDGGSAHYKSVGSEPSHALKVQSADGGWWEGVVPFMTPEMFGTAGDGVTNDRTKLQDMFDCPASDTVIFGKEKTYFFKTSGTLESLTITRAMHIYTNGSNLHHKVVGGSNNHAMEFKTILENEETWTETISAYATVLTITTSLAVGARVFIKLGEHPDDATQPHRNMWAIITANGGTTITINNPVPLDINGTSHSIFPVTPHEGTYIDVLRVTEEGSGSSCLRLTSIRSFRLDTFILKDSPSALGIVDGCENINIGSISGNGRNFGGASTQGRVLTVWGSSNIRIGTIDWLNQGKTTNVGLVEAGVTGFYVGQFHLKRVLDGPATTPCFKVAGTSNALIGEFTLTSNESDRIPGTGTTGTSKLTIGRLVINSALEGSTRSDMEFADTMILNGKEFKDTVQLYKRMYFNGTSSLVTSEWFYGVPRRAYARIDNTANITSLLVLFEDDTTGGFLGNLTSGEWSNMIATVSPSPALKRGTRFRLRAQGKVNETAFLETWVEFWRDPDVTELVNLAPWYKNRGEVTDTTDGSGDIVIAHSLGIEPRAVHVQMQGSTDYTTIIAAKDTTNFTVRVFDTGGLAKTSTSVTVSWSAAV